MQTSIAREQVVTRLHTDVYLELEKKVGVTLVTAATTPLQAGYQLGIQAVLKELRVGYVTTKSQ